MSEKGLFQPSLLLQEKNVFSSPFQHALFRYGKEKTFEFRPKKLLGKRQKQREKSTILKRVVSTEEKS